MASMLPELVSFTERHELDFRFEITVFSVFNVHNGEAARKQKLRT